AESLSRGTRRRRNATAADPAAPATPENTASRGAAASRSAPTTPATDTASGGAGPSSSSAATCRHGTAGALGPGRGSSGRGKTSDRRLGRHLAIHGGAGGGRRAADADAL